MLRDFDWQSEAWARGWAVTHPEIVSPRKMREKDRKACERRVQARIDGLAGKSDVASTAELELIRRGCIGCGACDLD